MKGMNSILAKAANRQKEAAAKATERKSYLKGLNRSSRDFENHKMKELKAVWGV